MLIGLMERRCHRCYDLTQPNYFLCTDGTPFTPSAMRFSMMAMIF